MAVYREHLAAYRAGAPELVLLHGWASSSAIWRSLLPELRQRFAVTLIDLPGCGRSEALPAGSGVAEYVEALLPALPEKAILCGWSLGGMLAVQIAAHCPERVEALISVAANARFVADESWPWGMAAGDYRAFHDLVERSAVKGLRRFDLLQCHGDESSDRLRLVLAGQRKAEEAARAASIQGLNCLASIDNRQVLAELSCPVMHILGERDALVNAEVAAVFAEFYPGHEAIVFEGVGHLPFLSRPDRFLSLLDSFCTLRPEVEEPAHSLNKREVGRSFSQAADSYDQAAHLQRRIADNLLALLPTTFSRPLLELGCGTGYSLPVLSEKAGEALLALDLAEGMLHKAAQLHPGCGTFLCADAEDIPLADASVGVIFSSLAVQWCENLPALFCEIERVLKPGACAVIATLGPETLWELREAWREVDSYVHVNRFAAREELEAAIRYAGLEIDVWEVSTELTRYARLPELTKELKGIGAHNVNRGRPGGLTGRARGRALMSAYERFRGEDGLLPASYEVYALRLIKSGI